MLNRRSNVFIFLLLSLLGARCNTQNHLNNSSTQWPSLNAEHKPWTRWWWHGNSVTKPGITSELEALQGKGFGGVELTPIFGIIGDEDNFVEYLSPKWMELLIHTLKEADRLGMKVDMATGTGWPFGGPWVNKADAAKYIAHKIYPVQKGARFEEKIEMIQEPIFRRVQNRAKDYYNTSLAVDKPVRDLTNQEIEFDQITLEDIRQPIASNKDMHAMAFDQVRFEEPLELVELLGLNPLGEMVELKDHLDDQGVLNWEATDTDWQIIAIFSGFHGKMVERAAPGGEGQVIDHFSTQAIRNYLEKFDKAFEDHDISAIRAFFNDSYEVDDAAGQANFTPLLFQHFLDMQGYDLRRNITDLFAEDQSLPQPARVISDYREVIGGLISSTFTDEWREWAHRHNTLVRNQAHGSPANILDLYAASDIPEAEGTQPIRIKFASSAGHVSDKKLIAAEAATWLDEHFLSNLADLKQNLDRYLVNGVNHVVYHGTAYSPNEDAWPGRLFYAAIHANDRNPMWHHWDALNHYVARVQSILQTGDPDNDILLYYPAYDVFGSEGRELLKHFDGHGPEVDSSAFGILAQSLMDKGYALDFISDEQIQNLNYHQGILAGDINYQTVVIPRTEFMPIATIQKLNSLAKQGATIVFHENMPASVPGWKDFQEREKELRSVLTQMKELPNVLEGENIYPLLFQAGVQAENMSSDGLDYIRRDIGDDTYYFITNWTKNRFDAWVHLNQNKTYAYLMEPMYGKIGLAQLKRENDKLQVRLQLDHGQSMLIRFTDIEDESEPWHYFDIQGDPIKINSPWQIEFLAGGSDLPNTYSQDDLELWSNRPEKAYQYFSGLAAYSTTFDLEDPDQDYILDLGDVFETAAITINDQSVGTLIGPDYRIMVDHNILKSENKLRIEVANKMANRIIEMDRDQVFWKKAYNINFPPRLRENRGRMGLFDTSQWNILPSGMAGPVTLTEIKNSVK